MVGGGWRKSHFLRHPQQFAAFKITKSSVNIAFRQKHCGIFQILEVVESRLKLLSEIQNTILIIKSLTADSCGIFLRYSWYMLYVAQRTGYNAYHIKSINPYSTISVPSPTYLRSFIFSLSKSHSMQTVTYMPNT